MHWLYCDVGLQIRACRSRRHVSAAHRQPPIGLARRPNGAWTMEFMADQSVDGRRLRPLTVVDVCTRDRLAIEVGSGLNSDDVVRVLTMIAGQRRSPRRIYCDNGSEFQSRLVDLWAYTQKVRWSSRGPASRQESRISNHSYLSYGAVMLAPLFLGRFVRGNHHRGPHYLGPCCIIGAT